MTLYWKALRIEFNGEIDNIEVFCEMCQEYTPIPQDLCELLEKALMDDPWFLSQVEREAQLQVKGR